MAASDLTEDELETIRILVSIQRQALWEDKDTVVSGEEEDLDARAIGIKRFDSILNKIGESPYLTFPTPLT